MVNSKIFPEIISITLNKYNSIDNKLYTLILDKSRYKEHNNTILVKKEDVLKIIKNNFKEELKRIPYLTTDELHREATSIYFLNKYLRDLKNLRWFQISLSTNLTYSRIINDFESGEKNILFPFKVIRGCFRTFDIFKEKEMQDANLVLKKIGCIKEINYSVVKLKELVKRLESLQESGNKEIRSTCDKMLNHLDQWSEDNPETLVITDYLDI